MMSNNRVIFSIELSESFGSDEHTRLEMSGKFLSKKVIKERKGMVALADYVSSVYDISEDNLIEVNQVFSRAAKELGRLLR